MFVSPVGKITRCSAYGWGYVGAPMAQGIHDSCTADAKAAGLIPMAEAGSIGVIPSTEPSSMRILKVVPGSPADQGGIKSGDSIVAIDGQPVNNWADARRLLFGRKNTPVKVTYRSGGVDKTVNLIRSAVTDLQAGMQP
jgi:S1-C subfamily serine protease